MISSHALQQQPITAGSWASHLRQIINSSVIEPHVASAGNILGARAVPCQLGPLLGVAWAVLDAPKYYRESAVAILQVVRNASDNGPARYAAWCLLDCCARVVSDEVVHQQQRRQQQHRQQQQQPSSLSSSSPSSMHMQNTNFCSLFLDEIERALPALIATHMPLSSVADPTIIDVDDDSQEVLRAKARLERRCFRRLYLDILNGWIRDPWFCVAAGSRATSSLSNLQRQIVEHTVLALCGTQNKIGVGNRGRAGQGTGTSSFNAFDDHHFNYTSSTNPQGSGSSSGSGDSSTNLLLAPEYFIKQEAGLGSSSSSSEGISSKTGGDSSPSLSQLARVKRETGLTTTPTATISSTLSSETLSKVLDLVRSTTTSATFNKQKIQSSAANSINNNNNNDNNNNNRNNSSATSGGGGGGGGAGAGDLLQETRRQVANLISELQRENPRTFKCGHCGTLFPKEAARNAHARAHHFPRQTAVEEMRSGQKLLLHRLPPPTQDEFISYLGDADSGTTAPLYITDAEYQDVLRLTKQQQAAAAAAAAAASGSNPALGSSSSSSSSSSSGSVSNNLLLLRNGFSMNHPLIAKRFSAKRSIASPSVTTSATFGSSGIATIMAGSGSGVGSVNNSNLVFVVDPLVKRSCFKCAKVFDPKQHPSRGWYLDDCVETLNSRDGQIGYTHKNCVF